MATNPPLFRPVTIEGMLLLHGQSCASADPVGIAELSLERHSFRTNCANRHFDSDAGGADLSYRLLMRDPGRVPDLLRELAMLPGVEQVSSMKAEDESEV